VKGRKHIALLVAYGPEVRAYLHSGLAASLAAMYDVSLIARHPQSSAIGHVNGMRLEQMPAPLEGRVLSKLRSWSLRAQLRWLRAQGKNNWSHYLSGHSQGEREIPPRNSLVGNLMTSVELAKAYGILERWWGRHFGTNRAWKKLYRGSNIDCLIASSYAGTYTLPALQAAANLGLSSVVTTNSWKDVYATTNVPVAPGRIVVWSEDAARDLLSMNPHIRPASVVVSDSLHLQPFHNPRRIMERTELCRVVGLDPSRPFLCYTAASPAAVLNEEQIVACLLDAAESGAVQGNPQVLLRLNPMEDGSRFDRVRSRYPGLVVQKPEWEFDPKKDWCCALESDVALWVAIVWHSALNVSISSTVTLEYATLRRPVVNVCFDLPDPLPADKSNRRFWDAAFYREIRDQNLAAPAFSKEDLFRHIEVALRNPHPVVASTPPTTKPSPVEKVLEIVREVVGT
jgi:hypothetical protein